MVFRKLELYIKTISVTTFKRPYYTQQVLQKLNACLGIEDYKIFIQCEPNQEVNDLVRYFPYKCEVDITINNRRLGCKENNLQVIERAFKHGDYNIHVEDDILLSKDALKYFEWGNLQREKDLFTVAGYNRETINEPYKVEKLAWFIPWGWATWKENFQEILKIRELNTIYTWDDEINRFIRGNRLLLKPTLARCQNIGSHGGSHIPSPEWHIANQYNPYWAESVEYGEGEFYIG